MIERVTVQNFKRFASQTFELGDSVVLVGPNNAGKSTLLQAIATWKLVVDRCARLDRTSAAGAADEGDGRTAAIPRSEFTAVPVRELNLLWTGRAASSDETFEFSDPDAMIIIDLEGTGNGGDWRCGVALKYANRDLMLGRRLPLSEAGAAADGRPGRGEGVDIVHVPPLSGVRWEEPS